jgi:hypothetical protein
MSNKWGIPREIEKYAVERDLCCVYCGVDFSISHESRKTKPTWEHIVNDIRITTKENIALCCTSCNASKGAKLLEDWLQSEYCKARNISKDTVAAVIKNALIKPPTLINKGNA